MRFLIFFVLLLATAAVFFAAGIVYGTNNALQAGLAAIITERPALDKWEHDL
jgi:hypothetical protein